MVVFGSVWSIAQLLCDHFRMSKSDLFLGVEARQNHWYTTSQYETIYVALVIPEWTKLSKNVKKPKQWRENCQKMFIEFFFEIVNFYVPRPKGGRFILGEAVAHAQGRYATPRGYAPLESTALVAFYCNSHESQQRGNTPRVKVSFMHFKMITL